MRRKLALVICTTLAVIGLDQLTKFWVVGHLTRRFSGLHTLGAKLSAMYSVPHHHMAGTFFARLPGVIVVPHFFKLNYAENTGAAWGMLRNLPSGLRGPLFGVITLVAVGVILYFFVEAMKSGNRERMTLSGLALILGGALGNYIDRLARGFVVDFLEAHVTLGSHAYFWPSFNVADSAICVGAGLLILHSLLYGRAKKRAPATNAG